MNEQPAFAASMRSDGIFLRELFKSLQETRSHIKSSKALIAESKALLAATFPPATRTPKPMGQDEEP